MNLVTLILFIFCIINFICSKTLNKRATLKIIPLSNCKAKLNDGRLIDLTSLDDPSSPRYFSDKFSL